jgi:glycerol-3-phosphate dehydrogenase
MVTQYDVIEFLKDINDTYPAAALKMEDVVFFYGGLYPDEMERTVEDGYQGARKDQILDHSKVEGVDNLISIIGVKYTMARKLAKKIIDLVFNKLGYVPPNCLTETTPVDGGQIDRFEDYLDLELKRNTGVIEEEILSNLIYNYGANYMKLLPYIKENSDMGRKVSMNLPIIKAQIIYAVRHEMAQKLSDVLFRRTGLGTLGNPGEISLGICASIMAKELGWDAQRVQGELKEAREAFTLH